MKIIFGIDITGNRKSTGQDGEEFVAKKVPDEMKKQADEKVRAIMNLHRKAEIPLPLLLRRSGGVYS